MFFGMIQECAKTGGKVLGMEFVKRIMVACVQVNRVQGGMREKEEEIALELGTRINAASNTHGGLGIKDGIEPRRNRHACCRAAMEFSTHY
jgi:hypothetical protein